MGCSNLSSIQYENVMLIALAVTTDPSSHISHTLSYMADFFLSQDQKLPYANDKVQYDDYSINGILLPGI